MNSITLANSSQQKDGYGAQIQRIFSIKALADSLGIHFKLNQLEFAERQMTQVLLPPQMQQLEIIRFNEFLVSLFPQSQFHIPKNSVIHQPKTLESLFRDLFTNIFATYSRKRFNVFSISDAYHFLATDKDLYSNLEFNSGSLNIKKSETILSVDIHLRLVNFTKSNERTIDPNFYFTSLDEIICYLELDNRPYRINIHSDFDLKLPEEPSFGVSPETLDYLKKIGLVDAAGNIDLETYENANKCKYKILNQYRNASLFMSTDPLHSLLSMANADFLVLSKSSYAFIAGVLNSSGKVFSPIYWNRPLTGWNKKLNIG